MIAILVAVIVVAVVVGFGALLGGPLVGGILGAVALVAAVAWLVLAGTSRTTPGDVARHAERDQELLGPGGPDDPNREAGHGD